MNWLNLDLVEKADDEADGARVRSAAEAIGELVASKKLERRPCLVWMRDGENDKYNQRIEQTVFVNEPICVALTRFHCFRVELSDLPAGDEERPARFILLDPALKATVKPIESKRMPSVNVVTLRLRKAFEASYPIALDDFVKRKRTLRDRQDKVDVKTTVIRRKRERLKVKPHAGVEKKLAKEEQQVEKERKAIAKDEKALMAECVLRPRW